MSDKRIPLGITLLISLGILITRFGRNIRYFWRVYIKRLPSNIYFALPFGMVVRTKWPRTNPLDTWPNWLEEHVGKRGIFWDWRICYTDGDVIEIKILKKKEAVMFQLMA